MWGVIRSSRGPRIRRQGANPRKRRRIRAALLSAFSALLFAATAYAALGDLTQKAGTAGCISDTGSGGLCQDGRELDGPVGVAISPDGKSLYAGAETSDALTIFDRSTATGDLTQKAGTAGCVSDTGSGAACQDGEALDGVARVAVSPDGEFVYATTSGSNSVAVFDRNTTTGELSEVSCVSETGAGVCDDGMALEFPRDLTVSPDGKSVYVASFNSDAVALFDRNEVTGSLTPAGCIAETAAAGCTDGAALDGPSAIEV